jgi:membrane protease YdiL (CAAX protease family)
MMMNLFGGAGVNKRLFLILLAAGIFGNIAVLPYINSLGLLRIEQMPVPYPVGILMMIVQGALFSSIAIFVGLFLGKKVGLGAPVIEGWLEDDSARGRLKSILKISIVTGVLVGISLFILDRFAFAFFVPPVTASQAETPLWQRFLVSFYGGICEEIFVRLFLVTLIVWISWKIKRTQTGSPTNFGLWLAIVLVSVLFGLGHLPMTATFMEITFIVVVRAIVLNGIAGVIFGWLYWKKGLEAAIISHFTTDIALHVILPSLI